MAIYCGWIAFEFLFIFFMYPETYGRTLEELAFCKCTIQVYIELYTDNVVKCSRTRNSQTRPCLLLRRLFMLMLMIRQSKLLLMLRILGISKFLLAPSNLVCQWGR